MKRCGREHAEAIWERLDTASETALSRAKNALKTYGPFASVHEASSVLEEELAEIKAEVFRKPGLRSKLSLRNEALDLAAVALRFAAQMDYESGTEGQQELDPAHQEWAES